MPISDGVGKAEERAFPGEGRERARRVPGERAAEATPAAAQAHGDEIVAARGREPRSGKAQEQAAALDEGGDLGERFAVEPADIGEDEDGNLLVDELVDRVSRPRRAPRGSPRRGESARLM